MVAKVLYFHRPVNGVVVEQRVTDGFINGTAMAVAHRKDVSDWLKTDETFELATALALDLKLISQEQAEINVMLIKTDKNPNSAKTRVSATYPSLVFVKRGSPSNGGGTLLHPDLALQLAQWCNKPFAIQVSRWIREWLVTGRNPIQPDFEEEWTKCQERYDIRMYLKDYLRPELMNTVVKWAENNSVSPITLCSQVHDAMNERIQGAKSQQIRLMGGLPLGVLIRDYFEVGPLASYLAINRLARNAIEDRGVEPIQAIHEACDSYLGKSYVPKPVPIVEGIHSQRRRLQRVKQQRQLARGLQLTLWGEVS